MHFNLYVSRTKIAESTTMTMTTTLRGLLMGILSDRETLFITSLNFVNSLTFCTSRLLRDAWYIAVRYDM